MFKNKKVQVKWQGEKFKAVVTGNFERQILYVVSVHSLQGDEIRTGNCSLDFLSHIIEEARK